MSRKLQNFDPVMRAGRSADAPPDLFSPAPRESTSDLALSLAATSATERRARIVSLIRDHGPLALYQMCALLRCQKNQISGRVTELLTDGLIERTGERRTDPATSARGNVYRLTDQDACVN